jgi:hypothetical protein
MASVRAITRSLTIACFVLLLALAGLGLERSGSATPASRTPLRPISNSASERGGGANPDNGDGETVAAKGQDAKAEGNKKCEGDKDSPATKSGTDKKKCRPPSGDDDHNHDHNRGD